MKFLSRFMQKFGAEPEKKGPSEPDSAPAYKIKLKASPAPVDKMPAEKDDITLELGDFLHRIPAQLLLAGPHDLKAQLHFSIRYLSERIASGETSISLAEIYNRIPTIFRGQVCVSDGIEIRFPWQKIARLIAAVALDPGVTPDPGAEALASKLRQRKPKKKTKAQTNHPNNYSGTAASAAGPILPGLGTNSATWFSRTTAEPAPAKSLDSPRPANPAATPKREAVPEPEHQPELDQSSPTPPAASTPDKAPADRAPDESAAPPATSVSPEPADKADAATNKPEDEIRIAELPAELQQKIARLKGSYERQIGELERTRKNTAVEMDQLREELQKVGDTLAEEQTANSVSRKLIQKAQTEREQAQRDLAEVSRRFTSLESSSKLEEITAERDALLQQKAHLSAQVAELSKRGISPARTAESNGVATPNARQTEELQRRISLMEASQREAALELAREKELRAKAEKMLAAADKLQEQSANYMESAKTEMRKEIEASVKVREFELRKSQKELQDRINVLSNETRVTATELENARKRITELESAPAPEGAGESSMQANLVAQLEEDIDNYRARLKTLIAERDEARASAERASGNPDSGASSEIAAEEIAGLRELHARQERELQKLKREHAEAEARFATEQAGYQRRFESLRQALDAARDAHAAQLASIQNKDRKSGDDSATTEAQRRADEAEKLAAGRGATIAELQRNIEALRRQSEEADRSHSDALAAAELKRESADKARDEALESLREQSVSLEQQISALASERDQLRAKCEQLAGEVQKAGAAYEETLSALETRHTEAVRAKSDLENRVTELEQTNATIETRITEAQEEHARVVQAERNACENLNAEIASLREELASVKRENEPLVSKAAETGDELARLREKHAESLAQLDEEVQTARAAVVESRTSTEAVERALAAEKAARAEDNSAAAEEIQSLAARLEEAIAKLDALSSRHADELAGLREETAAVAQQRDALLRQIDGTTTDTRTPSTIAGDAGTGSTADVLIPEILPPGHISHLNIPLVRPVPVPPPRVNRG